VWNADLGHSSSICHRSSAARRLTCTDFPVNDLVQLLADYDYSSLRYYGDHGVTEVERDADQRHSHAGMRLLE
jgi:hypothetical protein